MPYPLCYLPANARKKVERSLCQGWLGAGKMSVEGYKDAEFLGGASSAVRAKFWQARTADGSKSASTPVIKGQDCSGARSRWAIQMAWEVKIGIAEYKPSRFKETMAGFL